MNELLCVFPLDIIGEARAEIDAGRSREARKLFSCRGFYFKSFLISGKKLLLVYKLSLLYT